VHLCVKRNAARDRRAFPSVDEAVVRELKKRAARRNHSAEQEHREILERALLHPKRRSLAEVLAAIPDAGTDADFERSQIDRRG
jgi:antitoxin FitA